LNEFSKEGDGTMNVGFVGTGNMGLPMALNLVKAGYDVLAFDQSKNALIAAQTGGARASCSLIELAGASDAVITMLPAGKHVSEVYRGQDGLLAGVSEGTILVDCSTIDVKTARAISCDAKMCGLEMLDAPVSGGIAGAEAGSLTFMVGGEKSVVEQARPLLEVMGTNIVHAGVSGNGQAAKVCNNMLLGISMIAISESFTLGERLGLDPKTLFEIISSASGDCWALRNHLPIPGIVEAAASNRAFLPGFAVEMMAKDLRLAEEAAKSVDLTAELGRRAAAMYTDFEDRGNGGLDYSAIINSVSK
jgi:3-hydroxyisobutyrate dehydrogenase